MISKEEFDKQRFDHLKKVSKGQIYMAKNPFKGKNSKQRGRLRTIFANFRTINVRRERLPIYGGGF